MSVVRSQSLGRVMLAGLLVAAAVGCSSSETSDESVPVPDAETEDEIEVPVLNLAPGAVNLPYPPGFTTPGRMRSFAESIGVSGPVYRYGENAVVYLMSKVSNPTRSDIISAVAPGRQSYQFFENLNNFAYGLSYFECTSPAAAAAARNFPYTAADGRNWSGVWGDRFYIKVKGTYEMCGGVASYYHYALTPIGWQNQSVTLAGPAANPDAGQSVTMTATSLGDTMERGPLSYEVSGDGCSVTQSGVLTNPIGGQCEVTLTVAQGRTYLEGSATKTVEFTPPPQMPRTIDLSGNVPGAEVGDVLTLTARKNQVDPLEGDGEVTWSITSGGDFCSLSSSVTAQVELTATGAGTCSIQASVAETATWLSATSTAFDLPIDPRAIAVTASSQSIVAGSPVSSPTVSVSSGSLLTGDEIGSATFAYVGTGETTYGPSSDAPDAVGTYSVVPSGLTFDVGSAANYDVAYSPGSLTIGAVAITVAASSESAMLGDDVPSPSVSVSSGDLLDGDAISSVEYSYEGTGGTSYGPSATAPSQIGTYSVTPSALALETGDLSDYSVTYEPGSLVITARSIEVTVGDLLLEFGDGVEPSVTLTAGSLLSGDVIDSASFTYEGLGDTDFAASATAPTERGSYSMTPGSLTLSSGDIADYDVTYVAGALGIGERPIEISASSADIEVGETFSPTISVTLGSLRSGDVLGDATFTYEGTGDTTYAASTTAPTAVGSYSVTPSAAALATGAIADYSVVYLAGVLTISEPVATESFTGDAADTPSTGTPSTGTPSAGGPTGTPSSSNRPNAESFRVPSNPVRKSDGTMVELSSGSELVLEGDDWAELLPADAEIVEDDGELLIRPVDGSNSYNIRLVAQCGVSTCPISSGAGGDESELTLVLDSVTRTAQIRGSGFKPGFRVQAWLFSDPTNLGSTFAAADGTFTLAIDVTGVEMGSHTLQVNGVAADGSARSANLGVLLEGPTGQLPATGRSFPVGISALLIALGMVALGLNLRRVGTRS